MATEIERKYLLREPPNSEILRRADSVTRLSQGYLPGEIIHERFTARAVPQGAYFRAESFVRCVKIGNGIKRLEFQERVSRDLFNEVWPLTLGRRIEKTRYVFKEGSRNWELDIFHDRDLCILEVELEDEHMIPVPPTWLVMSWAEVTGDLRYEGFYMGK